MVGTGLSVLFFGYFLIQFQINKHIPPLELTIVTVTCAAVCKDVVMLGQSEIVFDDSTKCVMNVISFFAIYMIAILCIDLFDDINILIIVGIHLFKFQLFPVSKKMVD